MNRESGMAKYRPLLPWAAVLIAVAFVVPVVVAGGSRLAESASAPSRRAWGTVRSGGAPYFSQPIASLGAGNGATEVAVLAQPDGLEVSTFEMIAPTPDGAAYWIADHPSDAPPGARLRLYDMGGTLLSSFHTPSGTTIFTPGPAGELWVDLSEAGKSGETLLRYSRAGKLLASYPLPEGLLARAIYPLAGGGAWVLNEESLMDPETQTPQYSGSLVHVVDAKGKLVANPAKDVVGGTFIGYDGRFYALRGEPGSETAGYPVYTVTATDPKTDLTETFKTSGGVRPFMADARGRVYAESFPLNQSDIPGVAVLGDLAVPPTRVDVLNTSGTVARLSVATPFSPSRWAPALWPAADGTLLSAIWDKGRLSLMRSVPATGAGSVPVADAEPKPAQARILVPEVSPYSGDPYFAIDDVQRDVWQLVYSGLVSRDASLAAVPDLAESIPVPGSGVSDDGRTIVWRIAPGRTWHDGQPVTAQDVVATWQYLRRPTITPRGKPFPGFELIETVQARDNEVVVRLKEPFGVAPVAFFPFVLPAHIIGERRVNPNGGLGSAPMGSGPFRVARWEDHGAMMLTAHEDSSGRPKIDRLDVSFVDRKTVIDEYRKSPVPTLVPWLLPQDLEVLRRHAVGVVTPSETGRWIGLVENVNNPVLADDRMRAAVASMYPYATSWQVNGPAGGSTTVGPFQSARHVVRRLRSDPATATATRLIERAGWKKRDKTAFRSRGKETLGLVVSLAGRYDYPHEIPAEVWDAMVKSWNSVGIKGEWAPGSPSFYYAPPEQGFMTLGRHFVALGVFRMQPDPGWGSIFDPADEASWAKPWGIAVTGTQDAQLRELHARARRSYDPIERAELGRRIAERVKELRLAIFEFPETRYTGDSGIEGHSPGPYPAGDFWNARSWEVKSR